MNINFKKILQDKLNSLILGPLVKIFDENVSDIVTTFGRYVIREIRGKLQRGITIDIGSSYNDWWMELALYNIFSKYNDLKKCARIEFGIVKDGSDNGKPIYRLESSQAHNLKYRDWNILVVVLANKNVANTGKTLVNRVYTIIVNDTSPKFINAFEQDMLRERDRILKIDQHSPFINVYQDGHEYDGSTYWYQTTKINKRKLGTVYLPREQKLQLINTLNNFFASKKYYIDHGIAHNLKILLYGPGGTGKDSIVKAIATEWNRNIYYCTGGKNGKFMPNAITDSFAFVNPLILVSDIDKYPFLVNEANIDMSKQPLEGEIKDEQMQYKQLFGNMINALDGMLSGEDKIVVMTTNHPEIFSEVFLRNGRIDLSMKIDYIIPETFRKYVYDFYKVELPENIELKDDKLTIAKLNADVVFMKLSSEEFIKKYVK